MRELEEQLAEQERLLTPVLKLKKPDFEYKPLPPIDDGDDPKTVTDVCVRLFLSAGGGLSTALFGM